VPQNVSEREANHSPPSSAEYVELCLHFPCLKGVILS
jgi:hypothetical protein